MATADFGRLQSGGDLNLSHFDLADGGVTAYKRRDAATTALSSLINNARDEIGQVEGT
jgi:hypothetical protein